MPDEERGGNAATKAPVAGDAARDGIADPGSQQPPTAASTDSTPLAESPREAGKPQAEGELVGDLSDDRFQATDN